MAPNVGLNAVFIGPSSPTAPRPPILDFSGGARDIVRLEPLLKQTFYIGNGKTSQGQTKQIVVPDGATRFFLAVMDCAGCTIEKNGSFTVNLSLVQ